MQSVRRELTHLSMLGALVFAFALAWGSPFVSTVSARAQAAPRQQKPEQPQKPDQNQSKSKTFTGTIARDGGQFVLHDSSGATYTLDDTDRAKAYEGKNVKVTGQLDEDAKLIHVESIESMGA